MSEKFYHPYNFIPVSGEINSAQTPIADYDYHEQGSSKTGASNIARHDLYMQNHLSGRIICQIGTLTPTVVGNKHKKHNSQNNSPTTIEPYRWKGQIAIPANSLRGMISNIAEILSQSSLRILDKKYWPSFQTINPNMVPWHKSRCDESGLTPAELLFGAVEDNKNGEEDSYSNNLASRVRFYDALSPQQSDDQLLPEFPLKELGEPDPEAKDGPAGNFNKGKGTYNNYFLRKDDTSPTHLEVTKELDRLTAKLLPRGRKFYLLHQQNKGIDYYKNTKSNDDRKAICKPIKQGELFYFHIDFENLTKAEFTLLKRSLVPVNSNFYHRIGLGKPLGLGIVQVKPCHIFFKDSADRYTNLTAQKYRYQKKYTSKQKLEKWQELRERYQLEIDVISSAEATESPDDISLIDETSLNLLTQSGNYDSYDSNFEVKWRGKRDKGAPLSPLSRMSIENEKLPFFSPPDKYNNKPQEESKRTVNYIQKKDEEITPKNEWIRKQILESRKITFDEMHEYEIIQKLTSKSLAQTWLTTLPEKEADEIAFKRAVKQLILNSVEMRGLSGYWKSGGSKQAKKIYDQWEVPEKI